MYSLLCDFVRRPLLLSAAAWLRGLRARGQGVETLASKKRDRGVRCIRIFSEVADSPDRITLLPPRLARKTAARNHFPGGSHCPQRVPRSCHSWSSHGHSGFIERFRAVLEVVKVKFLKQSINGIETGSDFLVPLVHLRETRT